MKGEVEFLLQVLRNPNVQPKVLDLANDILHAALTELYTVECDCEDDDEEDEGDGQGDVGAVPAASRVYTHPFETTTTITTGSPIVTTTAPGVSTSFAIDVKDIHNFLKDFVKTK